MEPGGKVDDPFLPESEHHGGEGILPWWCLRASLHHREGHYSPIWYNLCAWQYQCQGTLHVNPRAHGTNAQSPVAYSSGTNCDLWRIISGVLSSTHLSAQLKCLFHWNPCKDCGWPGHPCQSGTTGGPPNEDFRGRDGSWSPCTSKASGNGPNLSKNWPGRCCLNGNTYLPAVTWTFVGLP